MGLVAPSKDHSMFLKRTRHRLCIGQEWCIGREVFFFFLVLQLDTSRILKTIFPRTSLKWHLVLLCFASQLPVITAQLTPWYRGVRLTNHQIGFLCFLHFLSNAIPVSDRREKPLQLMNADRLILRTVEVLSARNHQAINAILKREHLKLSRAFTRAQPWQSESPCQYHAAKEKYSSLLLQPGKMKHCWEYGSCLPCKFDISAR